MDDATLLSWIERGQNVAALLVAIGVAAEFLLGFMALPVPGLTTPKIPRFCD
jgi:hypothetical protein